MERGKVQWSDLPKEIWPMIGNYLDHRVDVLRFRSVCTLWRSSIPPFQQIVPPPLPLRLSHSAAAAGGAAEPQALLSQTTVYRMESLVDDNEPKRRWLVKFEESDSGKLRLLNPITNSPLRYSPNASFKTFNLLDFRVVELCKSYSLTYAKSYVTFASVNKVAVLAQTHLGECGIVIIYNGGRLGFMRIGDEKWTLVDEQNSYYDDVIVYKGQCYVVDKWGTISWVNSELKVIQFSPPLCGFGGQKHLVECCGELYVVDRYLDKERSENERVLGYHDFQAFNHMFVPSDAEVVGFKVYKLDQEWGTWVDVKDLGDQVFLLSHDGSFSVSTRDFARVKGNCIFFTDFARLADFRAIGRLCRNHSRVFSLEDGSIRNLVSSGYSQMLWPPTTWLSPD